MIKYLLNGKVTIIIFIIGLIKKISLYKLNYFLEPYTHSKKKAELDLSNFPTKSDLKNAAGVDISTIC